MLPQFSNIKFQDMFQIIDQNQKVSYSQEDGYISSYCLISGLKDLVAINILPKDQILDWIKSSTQIKNDIIYFSIYAGSKKSVVYWKYNSLIGGRLIAEFETKDIYEYIHF